MLETLFLYSALGGGVVLLLQLVLLWFGMDDSLGDMMGDGGDAGFDSDHTTDSTGFWFLEMLSLRTLSAAATFFGLTGKALLASGTSPGVSLAIALGVGYAALYSVYWVFKQVFQLETSGNTNIANAIGLPAQVYVPIGPGKVAGKVQMKLQGRTVEYQAVSDEQLRLTTGTRVVVTDVVTADTVRVSLSSASDA
ncbi:hypothetical protein [Botrimarina hoheduenensis]|nr:hypothetical protein [Botrimarina hoheduenensis]